MITKRPRSSPSGWFTLSLWLCLAFSLAGCSGLVRPGQIFSTDTVPLNAKQPVGQTFVAGNDGLSGLQIFLEPQQPGDGIIQLHLRTAPDSAESLAVSNLSVQAVTTPGYYTFPFPDPLASRRQYYYAFLKVKGSGELRVHIAPGNTYLNGSAYVGHSPLDAQLSFRLIYHPVHALLGLVKELIQWIGILAIGLSIFALPGWALLSWFMPTWGDHSWMEKTGLACGLSLAIYPLFFLWTDLIGLRLGILYSWLPIFIATTMLLWKNRNLFARLPTYNRERMSLSLRQIVGRRLSGYHFTLLAILALLIFTRFWPVRSLEGPMWGDSYQHAVITQLLIDHGGLFDSWQPYTELTTFTYHFGFHSAAAVLSWMTRVAPLKAVLWTGQLLNLLAILSLYPLARRVGQNSWAGLSAMAIAGLLSPMPMFYTNWGRYTQLAGQVILPIAVYFLWTALEREKSNYRSIGLAIITLSGLALTHLRVLAMAGAFLAVLFPIYLQKGKAKSALIRSIWIVLGAGILFLPWFIHVFSGKIMQIFSWQIQTPASDVNSFFQQYNQIGDLQTYLPAAIWLLMLVALASGLWRRDKRIALIGLWWFLLLILTNPQWLGLPGAGAISNFALFIALYIPASLVIGAAFSWLVEWLAIPGAGRQAFSALAGVLLLTVSLWGARQRIEEIQPFQFAMLTRPDTRAASWIRKNTPAQARFFVNAFLAFGQGSSAGSDAGWWLPLLTGRQTTLPPMNSGFEQGPTPEYQQWINALTAEFQKKGVDHPDFLAMLRERQVDYIYIGQRQGQIGNPGAPVLEAEQLLSSPNYLLLYHQDHVYIFALKPPPPTSKVEIQKDEQGILP